MPLQEYHRKRNFRKTSEPKAKQGKKKSPTAHLMFVVQEHHASHLHYDFRLEWEGVLKSWAIPKGPSLDPHIKRLAVQVEDHPLSYGSFEGVIPEDEYGAGEVYLWDTGTWIPVGDPETGFKKGHLEFDLKGKKLKGRWNLIRTRLGGSKKQWLLIKKQDESARSETSAKKVSETGKAEQHKKPPPFIMPELAQLVSTPPQGEEWLHEVKFDGYRIQAHLKRSKVRLLTRTGQEWTQRFPSIAKSLAGLKLDEAVIDGEVVALNPSGASDFQLLQEALSANQTNHLVFYVFDLLSYSQQDLRELPLTERRKRLQTILTKLPTPLKKRIRFSESFEGSGKRILKVILQHHLEGLVSKRKDSSYLSGRNSNWLKIKALHRQEFVIGGYTPGHGVRTPLGALLLGVYKNNRLHYVGKVGTGFSEETLQRLLESLQTLHCEKSPFQVHSPRISKAQWIHPHFSAEVSFANWTRDNRLRAPVFHGLREDKAVREITKEESDSVPLTHPDKIIYPREKITKKEIASYYQNISRWMLPHIRNRPLLLLRTPEGAHKKAFYQKHLGRIHPSEIDEIPITEKSVLKSYMGVHTTAGVSALLQMGSFELHCWNSRSENLECPDQIVMDFDPGPQVPWAQVIGAAFELKKLLEDLHLKSFPKLSGGKGVHVHIPIKAIYSWSDIKEFSRTLALELESRNPRLYTTTMAKNIRSHKIFIDYLRNERGATAVAPYSLRARAQSSVALPLSWSELKETKRSDQFSLRETLKILSRRRHDPWKNYFSLHQPVNILEQARRNQKSPQGA